MKITAKETWIQYLRWSFLALATAIAAASGLSAARASQAYGTVNNFDCVNDTGVPGHGFEIEVDDCRSSDITYTYDYNHYGTPKIWEFTSSDALGLHTNVMVDYEAVWTNTGWSAYTAVPAWPIPPTMGHQFTNPGTNFGGEHFGVGFRMQPSKILYYWMIDNGSHVLSRGPQVNVSTPTFTYSPPAGGGAAQAQAVIPAIVPPAPPVLYEFSDACWVKVITTTTQTNTELRISDLMSVDPDNPNGKDWRNGQTNVEIETEWQILQIDYMSTDYNPTNGIGGPNGKLPGNNKNLGNSDDVVTYRYEFYAYVGPYDDLSEPPTHEALCQLPGPDGIHGSGAYSNTVVVGKFLSAQMSALDAEPQLGLIDHLPDGEVGVLYPTRSTAIAGNTNFSVLIGNLPPGLTNTPSGQVYGTPTSAGIFIATVTATASNNVVVRKNYPLLIADVANPAAHCSVDTIPAPLLGGDTSGDGVFTNGTTTTVTATPAASYLFVNWTSGDHIVSTSASYTFTNIVNQSLVANFVINPNPLMQIQPAGTQSFNITWLTNYSGFTLEQNSFLSGTNWVTASEAVTNIGANYQATIFATNAARFFRLHLP